MKSLKGIKNDKGQYYYSNKQLPEALVEKEREIQQTIKDVKKREESFPADQKSKIEVRSDKLYLNNQMIKKKILPPTTQQLFPLKYEKKRIANLKFVSSDTFGEKESQFIAMATSVNNLNDVRNAYVAVRMLQS